MNARVPSSVSIAGLRDSRGRRRQLEHQRVAVSLELPRPVGASLSKGVEDLGAIGTLSDSSAGTMARGGSHESAQTAATFNESSVEFASVGRGCGSTTEPIGEPKERCKTR